MRYQPNERRPFERRAARSRGSTACHAESSNDATPAFADGHIYVTTEQEGTTTVFRAGPKFEVVSSNALDGDCNPYCLSSMAVSQGQLFLKTSRHLWVIGQRRK